MIRAIEENGAGVSDEQIEAAVEKCLEKNPIDVPEKTSDLENDSGFITNAVGDLANYYLKSETYTRDEVKALISAIPKFSIQVVTALPTSDISTTTVYLLKSGAETDNLYTEYIYVNGAWEYLGKQTVDLSGYALKTEIPTKLSVLTNDAGFITKAVSNLTNYYLKSETYSKNEIDTKGFLTEHQDLSEYAKKEEIPSVPVKSVNGKTGAVQLSASDVGARANTWTPSASDVGADPSGTAASKVSEHNVSTASHNDIRLLISNLQMAFEAFMDIDDETMNQATELVAYMKDNRELIEQITTSKVSVSDIVDDYVTNVSNKPVSAAVAVKLKALIDAIVVPTKLSQLAGDSTHRTVTDAEKTEWDGKATVTYDAETHTLNICSGG